MRTSSGGIDAESFEGEMEASEGTGLLVGTVNVTPVELRDATWTTTGPVTTPLGTVTCSKIAVAVVTIAGTDVLFAPAKVTMLSAGLVLKPPPLMVTTVPGTPWEGLRLKTGSRSSSGNATTKVVKWVTSADATRPELSTMATNSVGVYCRVIG